MKESETLEDVEAGGKMILKFVSREWNGKIGTGLIWIRIRGGP
jgi:hypothetical protein